MKLSLSLERDFDHVYLFSVSVSLYSKVSVRCAFHSLGMYRAFCALAVDVVIAQAAMRRCLSFIDYQRFSCFANFDSSVLPRCFRDIVLFLC